MAITISPTINEINPNEIPNFKYFNIILILEVNISF